MAITKVINDAVDLNQASDYSGLRLPVGTTGDVVESFTTDYLVVAGGGGTGTDSPGGGGAGGLRTSYNNSTTTTNSLSFPSGKTAIATYMLDNNATDISGNYNGTETNITYNTGEYGGAAVFNGSSSYITTPSIIPANNFSFSLWVNLDVIPASSSNLQIIYNVNRFADNVRWYISVTTGGKIEAWNGANTFITSSNHIVNAGQWYHITYTASSTTGKKIYVDGIEVFTSSDTGNNQGTATTTDWQAFGRYFNASAPFYLDGKLDQARIYNTVLSGTDVSNIYNNEVQANSGGGVAAETSLTLTAGVAYDVTVGGGGFKTFGSNSVFSNITSNGGGAGGGNGSSSGYNGGNGGSGGGASGGNYSLPGGNGTTAQGYAGGSSGSQAGAGYPGGGGGGASAKGQTLATSSDNGGTGGDGVITNILNSTNATSASVGEVSGSNVYYSGGGGGSTYTTTLGAGGLGGGADGQKYIVSQTTNDGTANTGGGGGAQNSTGGSGVVILRYPTASVSSFTVTGTLNTPSTTDTLASAAYPTTNTAYYKLDGNATDSSGNGYNGTAPNVTWKNGRFSQAAVFNGSSSKIVTGLTLPADSSMSFSLWFKTATTGVNQSLFGEANSSFSNLSIRIGLWWANDNNIYVWIANGSSQWYSFIAGVSYLDGNWHNFVLSINGTSVKLYADGSQTPIIDATSSVSFGTAGVTPLTIGAPGSAYSGYFWTGSVDQVRIFTSALTASQITELYEEHYQTKFTEGSDTAIIFTEGTGTVTFSGVDPAPPQGVLRANTSYSEDGSASVIEHYNGTGWKRFDAIKYCTTNTLNFPSGAGCIASYNLDNNVDDIGNTYNGVNSNVTFNASGKFGAAAVFNGSSSFIQTSLSLNSANAAYSFWFKADSTGSRVPISFSNRDAVIDLYVYGTGSNSIGAGSGQNMLLYSTTAITEWNHVVVSVTGYASSYPLGGTNGTVTAKIYLNGILLGSLTPTPYGTTTNVRIGRSVGSYYYDGLIDQVRLFNDSLTSDEVSKLYNNEIACS